MLLPLTCVNVTFLSNSISRKFILNNTRYLSSNISNNIQNKDSHINYLLSSTPPDFLNYKSDTTWFGLKKFVKFTSDYISYYGECLSTRYLEFIQVTDENAIIYMIPPVLFLTFTYNIFLAFKNTSKEQELFMTITERNKLSKLIDISGKSYGKINKADIKNQKNEFEEKMLKLFQKKFKLENTRLIPYLFVYLWMKCIPTSVSKLSETKLNSWINYLWFDNIHLNDPYLILPIIHASLLYLILKNYEKSRKMNLVSVYPSLKHIWTGFPFLVFAANEFAFIVCILTNLTTSSILKYSKISNKLNLKCENTFNSIVIKDFFDKVEKERNEAISNYEDAFINPKLFPGKKFYKDKVVRKLNKFLKNKKAYDNSTLNI